jgi:Family of unknown function (DUF6074)
MKNKNLPSYNWYSSPKVIPFPCSRRIGKVRRVAEVLSRKANCPKDATTYWKRIITDLERQMTKAGIDPDRIETELQQFRTACKCATSWPIAAGSFPDDAS